ncbi:hypothetical protein [Cupriavidus sp. D384]|uniref:hypothetical protein n=1 Tax=Cupriavidus sp. D384 TaxID=1538095 RepID=UPI000A8BD61F|nr:hypothetical protein [Cupriavidus sp. D384]
MKKTTLAVYSTAALLTIYFSIKFLSPPNSSQSEVQHREKNDPSRLAQRNFLSQGAFVKVEDQSSRPGVKSTDFTATTHGIDSDNNGIRDDVQRYIDTNYRDRRQRFAMYQYTRAAESYLLETKSASDAKLNWNSYSKAAACLNQMFGANWAREANEIQAQLLNAPVRFQSYIETRKIAAGHIYDNYSGESLCEQN